jgi:hypothetical protein
MQQNSASSLNAQTFDEHLSLAAFSRAVWHSRLVILSITLMVMAIGSGALFVTAKYRSEGFLQFGGPIPVVVTKLREEIKDKDKDKEKEKEAKSGISLPDYKRYSAAFLTSERFRNYVSEKHLESDPKVQELLRTFSSRGGIANAIEPIYPFTKLDARELVEQPKELSNNVIGLRIAYEAKSPELAQGIVGLLGKYVMDSITYTNFSDTLRFQRDELQTKLIKLENFIISNNMQLDELERRANELRKIISRNPAVAEQNGRQVVTVTEENARYLPPNTQLATTEVQAAEAKEAILKAKREQQQTELLLEYCAGAKKILDSTHSGEKVLLELENFKQAMFRQKDLNNDVVKEIYNRLTVENQTAATVFLEKSRFIAGPTLPDRSSVWWSLMLPLFLALGLFLGLAYVFGARSIHSGSGK